MQSKNLNTYASNTWCPGCGNFGILEAFKQATGQMVEKGIPLKDVVLVSGIGCNSKIVDYVDVNSFCSLHGRPIASAEGIKMGNPDLKVVTSTGDGGAYNEGISHLIHAAKKNIDITVLVHDNRNFALTTSQYTATSPKGFEGGSTPKGSIEHPIDPMELMLASNATFIARSYSAKVDHLRDTIKTAVNHKGFSFVEVLQPCVTFFNTFPDYNKRTYIMEDHDYTSKQQAEKKIKEWSYNNNEKNIPIGLFYQEERSTYEEQVLRDLNPSEIKKETDIKKVLNFS